jgi:hypothetical protein
VRARIRKTCYLPVESADFFTVEDRFLAAAILCLDLAERCAVLAEALVIVVFAVVVLPLVETVVVALVLPDFVTTVFVVGEAFAATAAGVATIATAARELTSLYIGNLLFPALVLGSGTADSPARPAGAFQAH